MKSPSKTYRGLTSKEARENAASFRLMAKFFPDKSERLIQSATNLEWLARAKDRQAEKGQEISSSSGWQRHHPNQISAELSEACVEERQPSLDGDEEVMRGMEGLALTEQRLDRFAALIASVIWAAGFAVLWWLWHNRIFVHEFMETLLGFALFWIALFYALAWFPIRDYVSERLARRAEAKKC